MRRGVTLSFGVKKQNYCIPAGNFFKPRNTHFSPLNYRVATPFSKQHFTTTQSFFKRDKYVKVSTGIVGYPVIEDGRDLLITLYKKMLKEISVLPETDSFRLEHQMLINERLELLESDVRNSYKLKKMTKTQ